MKNTEATIEALKLMTIEERMEFLRTNRPELFQVSPRVASFGKAPKDGWKESDRVAKWRRR